MKKSRKQIEKEINRLISELGLDISFEDVQTSNGLHKGGVKP